MGKEGTSEGAAGRAAVVHIITRLELGGAQENTLYTAGHLERTRFMPFVLSGPGGLLDGEARALDGVAFITIPHLVREIRPLSDVLGLREIYRALKAIRQMGAWPVIVHTHSSKAGILGRWAARLAKADIIIHSVHGFGFHPRQPALIRRLFVFLERLTARITTAFIAVSQANIEQGTALKIFPAGSVTLIRSGIVIGDFSRPNRPGEDLRRELGIPDGCPIVGMIACFKPQKAPVDFIRAAGMVTREHPGTHFLLIGDGALRKRVEEAVHQIGLEGSVHLTGWRRDIPDLLHLMDVLVLTSRWEGLPRVCPQAMSAGVPMVATNVDGIPEAVADGVSGHLVPPGDIKSLAEGILDLLRDPSKAVKFGEEGSRRVAEFDARLMVQKQEELYRSLISRREESFSSGFPFDGVAKSPK